EGIDIPGPVPISFVMWEDKTEAKKSDTRIIVFTDADFLSNAYLNQYSNAEMGLNVINWLSELEYKPFLGHKDITIDRLDLTSHQKQQIAIILLLIPLFITAVGIWVWAKK
ncbi:MAG: hypothetical protein HQL15_06990, partial [Candidatus Omnitrophica bacterium]|nr:hypothetical protein [Candidatus Omnitrophota bacterium]